MLAAQEMENRQLWQPFYAYLRLTERYIHLKKKLVENLEGQLDYELLKLRREPECR